MKYRLMIAYSATTALARFAPIASLLFLFGCVGSSYPNVVTTGPVATVTVAPVSATIAIGATQQFTATAKDANGNVISGVSFTWNSSMASVATVNTNGLAKGVGQGSANITATVSAVTGSAALTVNAVTTVPVATVTVAPVSATIAIGATQQFTATAKDANGNVISGVSFTWNSSMASVATVNTNGLAKGVGQGSANVTATVSAVTGSAALTVNAVSGNAIPQSFYGFTINKSCSISNTDAEGQGCNNPENHNFPGLPFTWARSLGAGHLTWADLVQCDPTGSVCPVPGSGCSKDDGSCGQLVPNCQPNAFASDDPANCAYVWSAFDWWTQKYNANGVDWMFVAYYTPDYLSVRGSRCTAAGQADFGLDATCVGASDSCGGPSTPEWGCDPPSDIDKTPGSGLADGTDQNYMWFTTAFVTHLQQTGEHISYWEIWNEPNICIEWNHSDQANVDCTTQNPSGGPATGTVNQLVRMAQDAKNILPSSVSITSPPVTDASGLENYLSQILAQGGSQLFDIIDFHGYFNTPSGCPSSCPTPEAFLPEWSTLRSVVTTAGQSSKPVMNTEFSWGADSNVTDPDQRAALAARSYLVQESAYPTLTRVGWYGEDFLEDPTPNPKNNNLPNGGTGEFWASGATNVQDGCLSPDPVQGGYDCPAGLAMNQVATWTIGATFGGLCTCSVSPNGGNCSASPPTGIFQCTITKAEATGSNGLFAWDNTATTFPCSNAACGTTTFPIPPGFTSNWQDLNGNTTPLAGASTVTIGAKPILIE